MESFATQVVLPLVGLADDKVIRDPYERGGRGTGGQPSPCPETATNLAP
ncbi:MAG: hypothetical protein ACQESR_13320 [Planctomycetota bacterium]